MFLTTNGSVFPKKSGILVLFGALFSFLSVPSVIFAADELGVQDTTNMAHVQTEFGSIVLNDDIVDAEKLLSKTNIDVNKLHFNFFPSLQMGEILLNHGLMPQKFLNLVLEVYCCDTSVYNIELGTSTTKVDDKLVEKRNSLVKLALEKGISANTLLETVISRIVGHQYLSSFANSEDLIKIALERGATFSAINIVDYGYGGSVNDLPSVESAKLMLEKSLDPNKLMSWVLKSVENLKEYNSEKQIYEINSTRTKQCYDLVELAIKAGADPQKINDIYSPLFLSEVSSLLFEHGLTPNKFLDLVLHINCEKYNSEKQTLEVDGELVEERNKLIKLALEKGVSANMLLETVINRIIGGPYPSSFSNSGDVVEMALEMGAMFSAIKLEDHGYHSISVPPSIKLAKLMLGKSLDPNKLMNWALETPLTEFNSEKRAYELNSIRTKQCYDLIELSFNAGADPQKIDHIYSLPLLSEVSSLLFEHGLTPNKFLDLVLHIDCKKYDNEKHMAETDRELVEQRNKLIKLALGKGADFEALIEPNTLELKTELERMMNEIIGYVLPKYREICDTTKDILADKDRVALTKLKNALVKLAIGYGADPKHPELLEKQEKQADTHEEL